MRSGFARAIRAVWYGAALALPGPAALAADCRVEPTAAGPVAQVTDGRTLVLADGRTVRLAMIEVPAMPPPSASATERQAGSARASRAALAGLIAGNDIALAASGTDRYGRVLARAYVAMALGDRSKSIWSPPVRPLFRHMRTTKTVPAT